MKPRLIPLLLLGAATACAHVEPPPGGPEDRLPPSLLAVTPDSLAVVPGFDRPVTFVFDERISEQGVDQAVMVSPRTSPVEVDHGGGRISVSLREGWRPGLIYHVTLAPGLRDLFNNPIAEPAGVVFSTGPEIPQTRLAGTVYDRVEARPATGIRVEAVRAVDSLVYAVPTDSAGEYVLARIPEGEYLVRAFEDLDNDRTADLFERQGTALATVTAGDTARATLAVLMPDTTAPQAANVRVQGGTLLVEFDDYLAPAQVLLPRVTVTGPEGGDVPLRQVTIGEPPAEEAEPDTAAAAPEPQPEPEPAETEGAPFEPATRTLGIELATGVELVPEAEYRIRVQGIENLAGLVGDAETTFTAPVPPPPAGEDPPAEPGPAEGSEAEGDEEGDGEDDGEDDGEVPEEGRLSRFRTQEQDDHG